MTKDDWKDRLAPALSTSLREVSDRITRTSAVQTWLHEASFEAARGVAEMQGMQAEAMGYMHMIQDLEATFPELVAAVDELTDGAASLDLDWRPLTPNFSRVTLTFDWDQDVKMFYRLDARTETAVREALQAVAEALPTSDPFPNRPNTATGVVAHDGRALAVQAVQSRDAGAETSRLAFTLLPKDRSPLEDVDRRRATHALVQYFASGQASGSHGSD